MIVGCELILGSFALAYGVALAQQLRKGDPQSTISVFAQLGLVANIGVLVTLMIAVARDPTLTFSPKLVFTT